MIHNPEGAAWQVWLESSALAIAMRQWLWLYPAVEIVHIAGIAALVGGAIMFDLRLLGLSRGLPVAALAAHLLPWARVGLGLVVVSGALMFTAHATEWAENPAFRLKMLLIVAAGVNAWAFHRWPFRSVARWDRDTAAPPRARLAAVASIVLWVAVIACGRLLAYL
ncbi:MAG TPA: DUF6644 family protein [Methylomirabilota bacterium]|nr:DUF6644 family protein [Methylomirabilota bacterium]